MGKRIRVTGRMCAFRKIPSGKLVLIQKKVEPLSDGRPLYLEVQAEPEDLEFKNKPFKGVLVRKCGCLTETPFYIRLDEIDAADHDQTLQRRYISKGPLRTATS